MSAQKSNKSNSTLFFLALVLLALTAFIVVAYYNISQEFEDLKGQMALQEKQNKREIESVMDQMNKRYLTLLKQADDIDQQRGKLAEVNRSISAEREALGSIEDNFHNELAQLKKQGTDSNQQVSSLEEQFNQEIKGKAVKLAKLEDDYQGIKNELEDQEALLVMMREQSLLDRYKHPQDGRTTVDQTSGNTTPADGTTTPADSVTPVNPAPASANPAAASSAAAPMTGPLVPTNNRVVTDLPTPTAPQATPVAPAATPVAPATPAKPATK